MIDTNVQEFERYENDTDWQEWNGSDLIDIVPANWLRQTLSTLISKQIEAIEKLEVEALSLATLHGLPRSDENLREMTRRACDERQNSTVKAVITILKTFK